MNIKYDGLIQQQNPRKLIFDENWWNHGRHQYITNKSKDK